MNNVTPMVRPSLRAARVVYYTDMTRSNSRVIPLGIFCEITLPHGLGLGLKARSALSEEEAAALAPIFRGPLSNPFNFLAAEFDLAWGNGASALDFLARKHAAALSVLAPYQPTAERSWYQGEPEVRAKLENAVDREFAALLATIPPADTPAPKGDTRALPVVRTPISCLICCRPQRVGLVGIAFISLLGCTTGAALREADPAFARKEVTYPTPEPPGTTPGGNVLTDGPRLYPCCPATDIGRERPANCWDLPAYQDPYPIASCTVGVGATPAFLWADTIPATPVWRQ